MPPAQDVREVIELTQGRRDVAAPTLRCALERVLVDADLLHAVDQGFLAHVPHLLSVGLPGFDGTSVLTPSGLRCRCLKVYEVNVLAATPADELRRLD